MQKDFKPYTDEEKAIIHYILRLHQIRGWTDGEIYNLIDKLREIPNGLQRFLTDMQKIVP